jgi:hypothetical protein
MWWKFSKCSPNPSALPYPKCLYLMAKYFSLYCKFIQTHVTTYSNNHSQLFIKSKRVKTAVFHSHASSFCSHPFFTNGRFWYPRVSYFKKPLDSHVIKIVASKTFQCWNNHQMSKYKILLVNIWWHA